MASLETANDRNAIQSAIFGIVADVAGVDAASLADDTGLDHLGIDSLLIVEVVVGIQRRFGVQVPPAAFRADIRTVGVMCSALGQVVEQGLTGATAAHTEAA